MPEPKTKPTQVDVKHFIDTFVVSEVRKQDSLKLLTLLSEWSGFEATMWGPSIIGFGSYHYQYASGHHGDSPILAFSPRKAALTLYVHSDTEKSRALLADLGKFKISKACLYINKLADINLDVLKALCLDTMDYIEKYHQCSCKDR